MSNYQNIRNLNELINKLKFLGATGEEAINLLTEQAKEIERLEDIIRGDLDLLKIRMSISYISTYREISWNEILSSKNSDDIVCEAVKSMIHNIREATEKRV